MVRLWKLEYRERASMCRHQLLAWQLAQIQEQLQKSIQKQQKSKDGIAFWNRKQVLKTKIVYLEVRKALKLEEKWNKKTIKTDLKLSKIVRSIQYTTFL